MKNEVIRRGCQERQLSQCTRKNTVKITFVNILSCDIEFEVGDNINGQKKRFEIIVNKKFYE
jgi:hypothetical protein